MQKFVKHDVYDLVSSSGVDRSTVVDTFINYTAAHGPEGSIAKLKARFLAKGYSQQEWQSFFDTAAPTPFDTSWRLAMTIAAAHDWDVMMHDDVNTAFLGSDITEVVHIRFPPDMRQYDEHGKELYGRLRKGMYGAQAVCESLF